MKKEKVSKQQTITIPVLKIRMMTDDEWNRLAYKNWIERAGEKHEKK